MTRIPGYQRRMYPADWNAKSKRIKTKAGWRCEGCSILQSNPFASLEAHHIDGNPQNIDEHNLIALCSLCHTRVKGMIPRPRTRSEVISRLRQQGRQIKWMV